LAYEMISRLAVNTRRILFFFMVLFLFQNSNSSRVKKLI
jgi:hypothetical protein